MRFLVDAQLPPALARLLTARGHHADHVTDIGRGDAPDRERRALLLWFDPLIDQIVEMVESGHRLIDLR